MNCIKMRTIKSFAYYLAILLIVLSLLSQEVEARRKILRGRKTVTRTYYRSTGVPAWAIVLLTGLGMILFGGLSYFIMKKIILDPISSNTSYSPPPMQNEI